MGARAAAATPLVARVDPDGGGATTAGVTPTSTPTSTPSPKPTASPSAADASKPASTGGSDDQASGGLSLAAGLFLGTFPGAIGGALVGSMAALAAASVNDHAAALAVRGHLYGRSALVGCLVGAVALDTTIALLVHADHAKSAKASS